MSQQEQSGKDVGIVILLAIVGCIGLSSYLNAYESESGRAKDKDEKIAKLEFELSQCKAEYRGYVHGRR